MYRIIYCGANKQVLTSIDLEEYHTWEYDDFSYASRQEFNSLKECEDYGKDLAKQSGRTFKSDDGNEYLD